MSKTSKYILISFIAIVIINSFHIVASFGLFFWWLISVVIADIAFSAKETDKE